MTAPICWTCMREMRCEKNSVEVRDIEAGGFPSTTWEGDRYRCEDCGGMVVTGFGDGYVPTVPTGEVFAYAGAPKVRE